MNERKKEKIEEIEKFLEELESVLPNSFSEYEKDFKTKAICERYFEKIVEAAIDLAFLILKEKNLRIPREDTEVFIILSNAGIISEELAGKLKDAKGMRNIIAHEYGRLDDELVFEALTTELTKDVNEFLSSIK